MANIISLLQRLEKAIRHFLWTGDITRSGAVTVAWSRVCAPKAEGGLGIRSLAAMNQAFLFRLAWIRSDAGLVVK